MCVSYTRCSTKLRRSSAVSSSRNRNAIVMPHAMISPSIISWYDMSLLMIRCVRNRLIAYWRSRLGSIKSDLIDLCLLLQNIVMRFSVVRTISRKHQLFNALQYPILCVSHMRLYMHDRAANIARVIARALLFEIAVIDIDSSRYIFTRDLLSESYELQNSVCSSV